MTPLVEEILKLKNVKWLNAKIYIFKISIYIFLLLGLFIFAGAAVFYSTINESWTIKNTIIFIVILFFSIIFVFLFFFFNFRKSQIIKNYCNKFIKGNNFTKEQYLQYYKDKFQLIKQKENINDLEIVGIKVLDNRNYSYLGGKYETYLKFKKDKYEITYFINSWTEIGKLKGNTNINYCYEWKVLVQNNDNNKNNLKIFTMSDYKNKMIKSNFKTESIEFNRHFKIESYDDLNSIKVLKPSILNKLLSIDYSLFKNILLTVFNNKKEVIRQDISEFNQNLEIGNLYGLDFRRNETLLYSFDKKALLELDTFVKLYKIIIPFIE